MSENNARARLIIEGRVQGVFYRAFTRETAAFLGLRGWVRNLPDGNVEAVLEGDKKSIGKAIAKCYKGPPASRVTNIDIKWEEFTASYDTFSIRY